MISLCLVAILAAPVTVESLLGEMTDLDRLATPADYTCRQFSSYDRASTTPDDPETWFANNDCGNYLRREKGGEFVLAEAEGPGAIVRIWSANPGGTIRIYLDGKVALEADFEALATGKVEPFAPPFGELCSRGASLYFPFPYAKSMKVTTSKGGQYYHVNYRTYTKGTKVETYAGAPGEAVRAAGERLTRPAPVGPQEATARFFGSLDLTGPDTITRLELSKIEGDLRQATIRMTFDGELCVCAPLGDFFGTAPEKNDYRTLPLGTWYSNFRMPFAKSARIEVEGAKVEGRVRTRPGPAALLRFHAWWRGRARLATRPMRDWTVLAGAGRGRYVGTALYVRNPVRAWWGEGDEKVYVDGEKFPSTFGTGTEDYFGYAWCGTDLFSHPYHSQSRCDGPGNKGSTAVNRFHVIDDIPFEKSIKFDIEVWHWAQCEIGYASVAYWYAEPGFRGDLEPAPAAERVLIAVPGPAAVAGAIEGEALRVLERSEGSAAEPQDMGAFGEGWSGDAHLWWRGARPGSVLRLEFRSKLAGRRKLFLALTKAPDYGIVRISVNGVNIADACDLFADGVVPAGEAAYEADLREGANELRVEIVGTNERAHPKSFMFGIDYLRVE